MFEQIGKVVSGVVYFIGDFFKSIVSSAERMESGACRVAMNSALYSLEHKEGVDQIEDIKSWEIVITRARRLLAENPDDADELREMIANAEHKLEMIKRLK